MKFLRDNMQIIILSLVISFWGFVCFRSVEQNSCGCDSQRAVEQRSEANDLLSAIAEYLEKG